MGVARKSDSLIRPDYCYKSNAGDTAVDALESAVAYCDITITGRGERDDGGQNGDLLNVQVTIPDAVFADTDAQKATKALAAVNQYITDQNA